LCYYAQVHWIISNVIFNIFEDFAPMEKEKEVNIGDVVKYLSRAFSKATAKATSTIGARAHRFKNQNGDWETTPLYDYQVKFCYLINDIERGPRYIATKSIQRANALIADLEAEGSK